MRIALTTSVSVLLALAVPAQEKKGFTEATVNEVTQQANDALQAQDFEAAATAFKKLVQMQPKNARAWHLLGYSLHGAGKLDEALKYHLKAAEFPEVTGVATYNVACVHALKGETEEAIEWLIKAQERGFNNPDQLIIDPDMDSLRDDPRFKKIMEKMKANASVDAGTGAVQVFAPSTERHGQRLFFWSGNSSPGQVVIDYGAPTWKDSYSSQIENMAGRRWRLGSNFWTVLDTNVDLEVAGVKVPAGAYYLTAEITDDGKYLLAFNDPAEIRKKKLDAFQAQKTEGGIVVGLEHSETDEVADKLEITLVPDEQHTTKADLVIHFGPHRFTAPVGVALEK